jgi:predicted phage terminase large subunit-like protein
MVRAWVYGDWDATPKGHIFEREWWKYYDWHPEEAGLPKIAQGRIEVPRILRIVQSWDTAYGSEEQNSKSACTTWGVGHRELYLLDCYADHLQFPALLKKTKELATKWKPQQIFIEGKASGKSIVQMMRDETRLPIYEISIKPGDDKETRAKACTPWIQLGKVLLPREADWVHSFIEELASFPKQKSDIVDSVSQAINKIAHLEAREEKFEEQYQDMRPVNIYGR